MPLSACVVTVAILSEKKNKKSNNKTILSVSDVIMDEHECTPRGGDERYEEQSVLCTFSQCLAVYCGVYLALICAVDTS